MRVENEVYGLILDIARNDNRIKAVYMNGSRTNESAPKDIFQDYDIVYIAKETKDFFDGDIDHALKAVFKMCGLFKCVAQYVGEHLGYDYNENKSAAALHYLKHVYSLSKGDDAPDIFQNFSCGFGTKMLY